MNAEFRKLLEALKKPAAYDHATCKIRLIETHISIVVLTGEFAYKLKKPVHFSFVDFRALPMRKFFCEEEVKLNRRTAPALYLGVVPITRSEGGFKVNGSGEAVEFAVKMRQFPDEARLDWLISHRSIRANELSQLARTVADFHQSLQPEPVEPSAFLCETRARTNETIATLVNTLPSRSVELERLHRWFTDRFDKLDGDMRERIAAGKVRECHGDLHLANIAIWEGKATPFDCVEFDRSIRTIDLMGDIAFLTMDLQMKANELAATVFLDQYLELTGDYSGLPLEALFRVDRAAVRAKVAALSPPESNAHAERDAYLDLAMQNMAERNQPVLILTYGLSGSGKSTCARALTAELGAIRIRADTERKRLAGLAPHASSHSSLDAGIYSATHTEQTYRHVETLARMSLDCGHHTIVDASFLDQHQRATFVALAEELGLEWCILEASAPVDILRARVQQRQAAGSDVSEANLSVLEQQIARQLDLRDFERKQTVVIRTEIPEFYERDIKTAASRIRALASNKT